MKNSLMVLIGFLILSSCKEKKGVDPIAAAGISLSPASLKLKVGETAKFTAAVTPENASDKSIEWISSVPNVATVVDGVVTAVKAGTTTITAQSKSNTSQKAECQVTVFPQTVDATAIKLNPAKASLLVNGTLPIVVMPLPVNATDNITWTSSNEAIATVSSGVVTGKAVGSVTITAASMSHTAIKTECLLTITTTPVAVTGVSLKPAALTLSVGGQPQQLEKTIVPEEATNQNVTYSSDKPDIVLISDLGLVTAKARGTTIITVTTVEGNKTAQCTVTVTVPVSGITLGPDPAKVAQGGTLPLTYTITPDDADNKKLTWSSSAPAIAMVDSNGLVVAGRTSGAATITATATDGSEVTKSLLVTVQSNDASISAITLGVENFSVTVPASGGTTTLANAPRMILSNLTAVPVTITAGTNATVKIGTTTFTQGQEVNFNSPVQFTVTAEDGITTGIYTLGITAYNVESNPYGIYNIAHLNDVRKDKAGSYKLMNNLSLPARDAAGVKATGTEDYATAGWLPIAHDAAFDEYGKPTTAGSFIGIFDGGSNSIDNLYINRTIDVVGLFGATLNATIKNLGVNGVKEAVAVSGVKYVGLVTGCSNTSTITQCFATGNTAARSTVNQVSALCGGLVAYAENCTINKCYAVGDATASAAGSVPYATVAGGLVGQQYLGSITDCYAIGGVTVTVPGQARSFAGGLVGAHSKASISNSYAASGNIVSLSGLGDGHTFAGGLICVSENSTLTNNYRNSDAVIKKNNADAAPDDASFTGVTARTKALMQTDTFKDLLNGTAGSIWSRDGRNDALPYIKGVGVGK